MAEERPVIGDFRPSTNAAPRSSEAASPPAPAPVSETPSTEDLLKKTAEELKALDAAQKALTPAERYAARLKDAGVSQNVATAIYDAVLTKGFYEEYVRLGKTGRAVFRTRMYEDALRLQTALERERPQLAMNQDDLITRYNLAASLSEWRGTVIPHNTDADFDAALTLVRRLPAPLFSLLATELAKFDQKTLVVFSEGAAENFS